MLDIDSLWDYSKPAESEARFRSALQEDPDNLELKTQLARSLGLQKKFDDAHSLLDDIDSSLSPDPSRTRVRYLLERGRTFNSSGFKDKALPLFNEAAEMAKSIGEAGFEIDALHMVAIADPDNSLQINLDAIAKAESSTDEGARKWLASLYNNVGWSYFVNDPSIALQYFQKAVPLREVMGNQGNLDAAHWCVARAFRELKRTDEALAILNGVMANVEGDPYVPQERALCLDDLGRTSEAATHAQKALEIFGTPEWEGAADPEIKARLESLVSATLA